MEIQLVLPEESQAEELALQRNDWEVIRYTGDTKYPYTKEDALADIRSFLEEENKSRVTRTILADGRPDRHRLLLSPVARAEVCGAGVLALESSTGDRESPPAPQSSFATTPFAPWTSTVSAPAPWKPIQAPGVSWKSWGCAGRAGL